MEMKDEICIKKRCFLRDFPSLFMKKKFSGNDDRKIFIKMRITFSQFK